MGSWLEQLIAESSGKGGKGILPVVGEFGTGLVQNTQGFEGLGSDRLFIYLRLEGKLDVSVKSLQEAGQPVLVFNLSDAYELGAEFYRWEVATAVACAVLGVNAFDQPDVQDAKDRTKTKCSAYSQSKQIDEGQPIWEMEGIKAFSTMRLTGSSLQKLLQAFMSSSRKGNYIAINAYLPRNPEMTSALEDLRLAIRLKTGCATTIGFGPRFLHSTGQMHKGGPDIGMFLQIIADPVNDLEIPGQGMTFATLERAQALGDYEALAARGRRILRIHLPSPETAKLLGSAARITNRIADLENS